MNRDYVEEEAEREPPSIEVITAREEAVPKSEPLATLVARMRRPAPPALDLLIHTFVPLEGTAEFMRLIRLFLPDLEKEILGHADFLDRMISFAESFSDRYFPIWGDGYLDTGDDYTILTDRINPAWDSYRYDDYEQIPSDGESSEVVIAYIMENPFSDSDRPAFAEAASHYLPKQLLERIPENGFEKAGLSDTLKGTPFAPVAWWMDYIRHDTGNLFADCGSVEEDGVDYEVVWNRPTVDKLTERWQEFETKKGEWETFKEWFAKDLHKNAAALIKLLERSITVAENKEPKTLRDVLDDWPDPESNPDQGRLPEL